MGWMQDCPRIAREGEGGGRVKQETKQFTQHSYRHRLPFNTHLRGASGPSMARDVATMPPDNRLRRCMASAFCRSSMLLRPSVVDRAPAMPRPPVV